MGPTLPTGPLHRTRPVVRVSRTFPNEARAELFIKNPVRVGLLSLMGSPNTNFSILVQLNLAVIRCLHLITRAPGRSGNSKLRSGNLGIKPRVRPILLTGPLLQNEASGPPDSDRYILRPVL